MQTVCFHQRPRSWTCTSWSKNAEPLKNVSQCLNTCFYLVQSHRRTPRWKFMQHQHSRWVKSKSDLFIQTWWNVVWSTAAYDQHRYRERRRELNETGDRNKTKRLTDLKLPLDSCVEGGSWDSPQSVVTNQRPALRCHVFTTGLARLEPRWRWYGKNDHDPGSITLGNTKEPCRTEVSWVGSMSWESAATDQCRAGIPCNRTHVQCLQSYISAFKKKPK